MRGTDPAGSDDWTGVGFRCTAVLMHCNICGHDASDVEETRVRSNVRKFAHEQFAVWRCPACKSIHARDEVDLAHYYADYPFHKLDETKVDWMLTAMYDNQLSRLRDAGVTPDKAVLDYGAGSGQFLEHLKRRGFHDVTGYDEYSERYADPAALERAYDCVFTQDLIEHVPEPLQLVETLHGLARPGGVIFIGTPNAESVDFANPEARVHTLHQPYHRHILSKTALHSLGKDLGWELLRYYPTMYANTKVPFVNSAFIAHYFKCFDNNCDIAVDGPRLASLRLYSPMTLVHGFFGYFWPVECDVMAVFRRA